MTLEATPPTRIQLCGPTVIELGAERIEARLPGRQGRLLFAYLLLKRHRAASRDELVDAVWPEQPPSAADAGLNALISKLRRIFPPGVLDGRTSLRLCLDKGARVDIEIAADAVHRSESQIALRDWEHAWGPSLVALFIAEREFLPGDDTPWIDEQRRALGEIHLRALEAHTAAALGIGGTELPAAVRNGRRLIRRAPLRETGYQLLMQALAAEGNVAEALRVYTDLSDTLRDELGVSPCATTQAVYDQLLRS